jgi:FecR protein
MRLPNEVCHIEVDVKVEHKMKPLINTKWNHAVFARHFLLGLLVCLLSVGANAAQVVGTVVNISGPLLAKRADGSVRVLSLKSEVEQGETLISEKGTYARVKFIDNSEITLRPSTQMVIDNFSYDEAKPEKDNAFFSLIKGGLRSITGALGKRNRERVGINTPTATIGIRGTTFIVQYIAAEDTAQASAPQIIPAYAALAALDASDMAADFGNEIRSDAPRAFLPSATYLQLAQNTPGSGGGLAPGLYVHVIDGLIQLSNRGGVQQFAAGQFGFTGSVVQPPVIVPNNPGIQFSPPPAFQSSTGPQSSSGSANKPKAVDCEVR